MALILSRPIHNGDRVVDVVIITREEGFGDTRIRFDQASEEIREAAEFIERNTVPLTTGASVDQPDGSY